MKRNKRRKGKNDLEVKRNIFPKLARYIMWEVCDTRWESN